MILVEHKDNETIKEMIETQLYEIDYLREKVLPINTNSYKWVDSGTIQVIKNANDDQWDIQLKDRPNFVFFDSMGGDTAMVFMGESETHLYYTMEV